MTDFVIDANVLMSMLISGKAIYRPILSTFNFVLPDFALVELEKYNEALKRKTRMNEAELTRWTYFVFSQVNFLPHYVLSTQFIEKAEKLLVDIDLKDTSYVAFAMQLDLVLLTRDVFLYKGLRKKGFRSVMLFEGFLRAS